MAHQPEYLFVYGTLRQRNGGSMAALLSAHGEYLGEAQFQGRLYRVDYYPGAVPSSDPRDRVQGEVYAIPEPALILPFLDQYEGCSPACAKPTEYVRRKTVVWMASGEQRAVWIYLFNRSVAGLDVIQSGDFLRRSPSPDRR